MELKGQNLVLMAGLGVAAIIALYIAKKGIAGAAAGAVGAVGDAAAGTVLGIGDVFGIPRTNETECERARREGRTWDASFACPAADFFGYLFTPSASTTAAFNPADAAAMDYFKTDYYLTEPMPGAWG